MASSRVGKGTRVLRHSAHDGILIALAGVHGVLLVEAPSAPLIGIAFWWTANTVAHNFIHLPFFRSRAANSIFSVYLSLLLGLPQTLWRDRHIAHHADRAWSMRWSRQMLLEIATVSLLWALLVTQSLSWFAGTWLLGWGIGLALCQVQGYFEHHAGTTSNYGRIYNTLFFNDGFHIEHHSRPGTHWSELPSLASHNNNSSVSRFPAVFRWLEISPLELLERIALATPLLQKFLIRSHSRAFRKLLANSNHINRATIVGGGLFPRTALVLQQIAPHVQITIIDRSAANIERAQHFLRGKVRFVADDYREQHCSSTDIVIFPLAFDGDKAAIYSNPPAPVVLVHDWIWRNNAEGTIISFLLLKRLNILRQ